MTLIRVLLTFALVTLILSLASCLPTPEGESVSPSPALQPASTGDRRASTEEMNATAGASPAGYPFFIETPLPYPYPVYTPFPAQPVTANTLPVITHDLLFVQEGTLMRWDHSTNQIQSLLAADAASFIHHAFVINDDGQSVVFGLISEPPAPTDIMMLDLETLATQVLVEGDNLPPPALSSDGQWIVYEDIGPGPSAAYFASTDGSSQPALIGDCAEVESERSRVCFDNDELWLIESGSATRLWFQPSCDSRLSVPFRFQNQNIANRSPSGRYRLITLYREDGSATAVEDMQMGWQEEVPNSFSYVGPHSKVIWLEDDRLLHARSQVELWRIEPEGEPRLVLERSLTVGDPMNAAAIAPTRLQGGRIGFALVSSGQFALKPIQSHPAHGLYVVDSLAAEPRLVNHLPSETIELLWAPDGSGALVTSTLSNNQLLYVSADGLSPYNLRPLIPPSGLCFAWIPAE